MTDLDTAAIRRRHVKGATWANSLGNSGGEQCNRCGGNVWPCDTLLLVDEIDALRVQLAQATAERDLFRDTHDLTSRQFVAEQKRAERAEAALARADRGWTHTLNEFAKKRDALARVSALLDAVENGSDAEHHARFGCETAGESDVLIDFAADVRAAMKEPEPAGGSGLDAAFDQIREARFGSAAVPATPPTPAEPCEQATPARCACGKPVAHLDADEDSNEWACQMPAAGEAPPTAEVCECGHPDFSHEPKAFGRYGMCAYEDGCTKYRTPGGTG